MKRAIVSCISGMVALVGQVSWIDAQDTDARIEIERFLVVWDSTWRLSERDRTPMDSVVEYRHPTQRHSPRRGATDCNPSWPDTPAQLKATRGDFVRSRVAHQAECPGWFLGGEPYPQGMSEADWLDAAITPARRATVAARRADLLRVLGEQFRRTPADSFVVGQLVRFAVDQREWNLASDAVDRCAASGAWCHALRGYLYARRAQFAEATQAFDRAWSLADTAQRCAWSEHAPLFERAERAALERASCAQRLEQLAWLWTLSDPLWIDPANQRYVEQFRRVIELALRTALPRDERWSWDPELAADSRIDVVLRYGWPSFVYWPGELYDRMKYSFSREHPVRPPPPYTTEEYYPGRIHLIPSLSAITAPFELRAGTPLLLPPRGGDSFRQTDTLWWPIEHAPAPSYGLMEITAGQTALLRRQSHVHLATAVPLDPTQTKRRASETIDTVSLLAAHTPDSVRALATARGLVGSDVVLRADLDARPAVLSIEFTGAGPARPAGRARFGIKPPPALNALASTDRAVSDPVLRRIPGGNATLVATPDSVLPWMLGTATIPPVGQVGVYWETYGFAPTDTVEHAVWIQRVTPQGTLRRLGISLNIATDRNTPVAVSWTESRLGGNAEDLGGPVRIIGRTLTVDVSSLSPGEYILEVAATSGGREAVRGQRTFTVAK